MLSLLSLLLACRARPHPPTPEIWLWAWEVPTDLRTLPEGIGVAFLDRTVRVERRSGEAPRQQPLRVREDTPKTVVVRLEIDRDVPAEEVTELMAELLVQIQEAARPGLPLQIDFDARRSERALYRSLLDGLRAGLSGQQDAPALQMTALASWCLGDNWIDSLPVDRVVPMLFDMGADAEQVGRYLLAGGDLLPGRCREAWGTSGEDLRAPPTPRPIYIFSGRPWSAARLSRILQEL
jgi:hypothetical protein